MKEAKPRVTKGLQRKTYDGVTPRPSWRRYFQAYSTLLDEGQPVSEAAIAKHLGISRMSLWRMHRRNPGLRPWVHEQLRDGNEFLVGPVVRMLGMTALRTKSPKHAELFLKAIGTLDPRDAATANGAIPFTLNLLIPRPPTPGDLPAVPPAGTGVMSPRPSDIPTVQTR